MISNFKNLFKQKRVKQISVLYVSMIMGIAFGVVISVVNTRLLGPEIYGDYKFIHSVYSFFTIIIGFGFLSSVGKMLAEKKNESIRDELIGSSILITLGLGVLFSFTIIIFSFFQSYFFAKDLSKVFLILSPLLFFAPFTKYFENIFQGDNKIYELAVFRQLPQLIYVVSVLLLAKFGILTLITAMVAQLSSFAVVEVLLVIRLKPKFVNLRRNISVIFTDTKRYGYHVYVGTVFGVASTSFAPIVLSYFSESNVNVGYFSLALTITAPLMMIPSVVGTAMFKQFANCNVMPKKATYSTLAASIVTLAAFLFMIKPVVIFLYTDKFIDVVPLTYIVAIAQIMHGYGNYYNKFLGAKGFGKELRNGAILVGLSNLIGFSTLVPYFGATGAAFTKLSSGLVFVGVMYAYYRKYLKKSLN
jgi:O-antigen/teichoic acid export membrane protein